MQRHLLPYSLRKQSPAGRWFCRHVWLGRGGAGLGQERRGDTTYFAPLLPTQTVSRLGGGFAAMSGWAGVVRRGRGASAGIQRTLLPMHPTQTVPGRLAGAARCGAGAGIQRHLLPMFPTQTVHRLIWPSAARARGWGGDTTDIAPLPPTQTVSRLGGGFAAMSGWARVVRRGRGASAGIQRTLLPMLATQTVPGWLGRVRRGCGAGAGMQRTLLRMHPTQTVPMLVWPGAEPVLGYSGHCSLAPHANSPPAGKWFCRLADISGAARGWGGCGAEIQRTLLPMLPTQTVPMLVWPGRRGAGAGAERRYNGHCSLCSLRKQSPAGWAGAARGQCWDTTAFAPHAPYANSPPADLAECGAGLGRGCWGWFVLCRHPALGMFGFTRSGMRAAWCR